MDMYERLLDHGVFACTLNSIPFLFREDAVGTSAGIEEYE